MDKEIECSDCGAVFIVDILEEGDASGKPKFCPFCGNEDLDGDLEEDDEYGDDEDELFEDDDE